MNFVWSVWHRSRVDDSASGLSYIYAWHRPLDGGPDVHIWGRYEDAAATLKALCADGHGPPAALALLARTYANQGNLAPARELIHSSGDPGRLPVIFFPDGSRLVFERGVYHAYVHGEASVKAYDRGDLVEAIDGATRSA